MVTELSGLQIANVKEKVELTAHIRAQSMLGKKATIQLKANGKVVDEQIRPAAQKLAATE